MQVCCYIWYFMIKTNAKYSRKELILNVLTYFLKVAAKVYPQCSLGKAYSYFYSRVMGQNIKYMIKLVFRKPVRSHLFLETSEVSFATHTLKVSFCTIKNPYLSCWIIVVVAEWKMVAVPLVISPISKQMWVVPIVAAVKHTLNEMSSIQAGLFAVEQSWKQFTQTLFGNLRFPGALFPHKAHETRCIKGCLQMSSLLSERDCKLAQSIKRYFNGICIYYINYTGYNPSWSVIFVNLHVDSDHPDQILHGENVAMDRPCRQ